MDDTVLVLGSGIYQDGSIPESAMVRTRKAVELYRRGATENIIFSGKWTYRLDCPPPLTEAEAMANYAQSLGLDKKAIILEKESVDTISNFCQIKKILLNYGWRRIVLIANSPHEQRPALIMRKVFGPEYICQVILTDFRFPPEKEETLRRIEREKIKNLQDAFKNIKDGDDRAILNYSKQQKK